MHSIITDEFITLYDKDSYGAVEISRMDGNDWYFNRLIVPALCRGKGVASRLMEQLIKALDSRGITLLCEINPYGEMDLEQLKSFYIKYGFVEDGHYLIRTPSVRRGLVCK